MIPRWLRLAWRRLLFGIAVLAIAAGSRSDEAHGQAAGVTIDYPEDGSIFPPEITPPTFRWRDGAQGVISWRIEISFGDGSPPICTTSAGEAPRIGRIDPDCIAETNELPRLTAQEAGAHTWAPAAAMWTAIKKHSVTSYATIAISGPNSRASIRIRTSRDPVGAPIFYRDVPLMPSEVERGVIKPLAAAAVPLVAWRLRSLAESDSRVVMDNLPVCANCHSFSADGKTIGMDLDGLQNNRGLYILASVEREVSVRDGNIIRWRTAKGALKGTARAGFLSQISPDGRFVATTIDPVQASGVRDAPSNYYVANF